MKITLLIVATSLLLSIGIVTLADEESDNAFYSGVAAYRKYDFDEAAEWFRKAAEAGDVDAQFLLGRMHYDGNSLTVDEVTALMWFDIAAANGLYVGERYRNGLARRMSEEDIALAKERAIDWRRMHPVPERPAQ